MAKKVCVVYMIQSLSKPQRIYIGSTTDYYNRFRQHKYLLKNNKHSSVQLQNHYNKYGLDDLVFEIIENGNYVNISHLLAREQSWYWRYKYYGRDIPFFNVNEIAGTTLGYVHKLETKLIIGEASKKWVRKPMSQATKDLISINKKGKASWNKGISPKPETIEKRRKSMRGFHHTDESKTKISKKLMGIPKSKKSIEKRTRAREGFTLTQESRNKISETLKRKYKEHPEWGESISKRQKGRKRKRS